MKIAIGLCFTLLGFLVSYVANDPVAPEVAPATPAEAAPTGNAATMAAPLDVSEAINAPTTPVPTASTAHSKCECAVFNTQTPTEKDQPIITQTPIEVACSSDGETNCIQLCSALAKAAHERGPQLLCSSLGHYNQLRASVHSRICGSKSWTYTGLTSPLEICCHEHQVVKCKDLADSQPTNQLQ